MSYVYKDFFVMQLNELSKKLIIERIYIYIHTNYSYREKNDLHKEIIYFKIKTKRRTYSYKFS